MKIAQDSVMTKIKNPNKNLIYQKTFTKNKKQKNKKKGWGGARKSNLIVKEALALAFNNKCHFL